MGMTDVKHTKVAFYVHTQNDTFLELFKDEIKSLEQQKIPISYHNSRFDDLPEVCINGYCVAGVSDIKHELNSLISA